MKYTLLIADDEPNAREYLADLVKDNPDIELIGQCESGNAVLNFCQNLLPDILLLDIQMPGLNGIETARKLLRFNPYPVIVFTTAFDQYAINAFEVEAVGYLLKPFDLERFQKALNQAVKQVEMREKAQFKDRLQKLYSHFKKEKTSGLTEFVIHQKGLVQSIATQDILFIAADSEYVQLHTLKQHWLYRSSLTLLNQQLSAHFLRIHRSYIINLAQVEAWAYLNNGTFRFQFSNGQNLISSRSFKASIQEALSGGG